MNLSERKKSLQNRIIGTKFNSNYTVCLFSCDYRPRYYTPIEPITAGEFKGILQARLDEVNAALKVYGH